MIKRRARHGSVEVHQVGQYRLQVIDVIAGHGVTQFLKAARVAGCHTANRDQMIEAVRNRPVTAALLEIGGAAKL
jgi:hypothetical protein